MVSQRIYDLGIAKQTAKGTAAAAAAFRMRVAGAGSPMPNRTVNDLEETGPIRENIRSFVSGVAIEGAPEAHVRLPSLGLLLYLALGSKAVSGVADPWTHTFTPANSLPWFTMWRAVGDLLFERLVDCKITQLTLTSEAGQPVRVAFTVSGLRAESIAEATFDTEAGVADLDDGAPLMHYDGAGKFLVEAAAVSSIERIVLGINNNAGLQQGDSLEGYDVNEGLRQVTVETTQVIEDVSAYNRFHYGSATPAVGTRATRDVLELTGGLDFEWEQVAAAPGPERSLRIDADRVEIASVGGYVPGTGNDPLKRATTYRLRQPLAGGSSISAIVINGETSY